ncbi:MAG: hypothetical protein AAF705_13475 [Bacteroidota bacterium]
MDYTQVSTPNTTKIAENQWAINNRLTFGRFTSCIGIAGYAKGKKGQLFGVHLVQVVTDFFNDKDAEKAANLVAAQCEAGLIKIFGCIAAWKTNPSYATLIKLLAAKGFKIEEVSTPKDDGDYTVTYNTVNSGIDIVKS